MFILIQFNFTITLNELYNWYLFYVAMDGDGAMGHTDLTHEGYFVLKNELMV